MHHHLLYRMLSHCRTTVLFVTSLGLAVALMHGYNGDYLVPDDHGYYPSDKKGYDPACQRCMASDSDWPSCYQCWDHPYAVISFHGKKKRNFRTGSITPYSAKQQGEMKSGDMLLQNDKNAEEKIWALYRCRCCLIKGYNNCCNDCTRFFNKLHSQ